MEPSGKYYASLLYEKSDCENQAEEFDYEDAKILGIDYVMHGMAVFSEDIQKENEGYFRKSEERLAREQRKLSYCVKGSNNYYRQKKRVALCHEKVRSQRKDFLHKLSYEMAEAYDVVARVYLCRCGNRIDRDLNAAINIREEARRMLIAG